MQRSVCPHLCIDSVAGCGASVAEADIAKAETTIIETMRREGLGRRMTDGQLLMILQHHAIPTRLIEALLTFPWVG